MAFDPFKGFVGGAGTGSTDPEVRRRLMLAQLLQQNDAPATNALGVVGKTLNGALQGYLLSSASDAEAARDQGKLDTMAQALQAGQGGVKEFRNPDSPGQVLIPGQQPGMDAMVSVLMGNKDTAPLGLKQAMDSMTLKQKSKAELAGDLAKKGLSIGPDGTVVPLPGYGTATAANEAPAAGARKAAELSAEAAGQPAVIRATIPAAAEKAAAIAGAETPALVSRAAQTATATAPVDISKALEIARQLAPIDVAKAVASAQGTAPIRTQQAIDTARGTAPIQTQQAIDTARAVAPIHTQQAVDTAQGTAPIDVGKAVAIKERTAPIELQNQKDLAKYKNEIDSARLMSADEVKAAGLPAGTVATLDGKNEPHIVYNPNVPLSPDNIAKYTLVSEGANAAKRLKAEIGNPSSQELLLARSNGTISNYLNSDKGRQIKQLAEIAIGNRLRITSGAAVTQGEIDSEMSKYFPAPGDDAKTAERKLTALTNYYDTFNGMLPPGSPARNAAAPAASGGGPRILRFDAQGNPIQ